MGGSPNLSLSCRIHKARTSHVLRYMLAYRRHRNNSNKNNALLPVKRNKAIQNIQEMVSWRQETKGKVAASNQCKSMAVKGRTGGAYAVVQLIKVAVSL